MLTRHGISTRIFVFSGRVHEVFTHRTFEDVPTTIPPVTHHACHAHIPAAPGTWAACDWLTGRCHGLELRHELPPWFDLFANANLRQKRDSDRSHGLPDNVRFGSSGASPIVPTIS